MYNKYGVSGNGVILQNYIIFMIFEYCFIFDISLLYFLFVVLVLYLTIFKYWHSY